MGKVVQIFEIPRRSFAALKENGFWSKPSISSSFYVITVRKTYKI